MFSVQAKSLLICLLLAINYCQDIKKEQFEFTAEVTRLMDILINSLYTQKQIFLRELISNASDALDKIQFQALTDPEVLGETNDLEIRIQINEEEKYIQVRDTGVGMTRQEMIQNLGTIAKSGTTNFLEALKGGSINLIGQFGVGFYSSFLAGAKVEVISKSNNDDQYIWVSEAAASFSIMKDPKGNTLGRGTVVRIYLKEDSLEFLSHSRISRLIHKYSEFIDFPIFLYNKIQTEEEVAVEPSQKQEKEGEQEEDLNIKEDEGETKPEMEKVKKVHWQWERINTNKAIWLREKDDIYQEDYIDFYKSLARDDNPPMNWIHFNTEGEVLFSSILFIPTRAPQDFYMQYSTRKNHLKLYVRRVLITQNKAQLVPKYLSFVEGVIDSDDFPLSVDRETLQQTKTFKIINQKLTKKILDMITEIANWDEIDEDEYDEEEEDSDEAILTEEQRQEKRQKAKELLLKQNKERFDKFYQQFGKAIKLGILDDKSNRNKLASLSRWYTTKSNGTLASLDDYVERMKSIQDQIYFFSGQDKAVLEKSPLVVGLARKGYEVILCDDPIDEYVFNVLRQYQEKNIVNVGKGDFKMPDDDQFQRKKQKFITKKFQPYAEYAKKLLFEKVGSVVISNRLTNQPCVVVADSYGHSSFMDKVQKAAMFSGGSEDNPTSNFKKILEINPHHKVNQIILERINNQQTDEEIQQLVHLLYEAAAFNSGFSVKQPNDFVTRFYKIYSQAMGVVDQERKVMPVEDDIELEEEDYEADKEDYIRVIDGPVMLGGQGDQEQ